MANDPQGSRPRAGQRPERRAGVSRRNPPARSARQTAESGGNSVQSGPGPRFVRGAAGTASLGRHPRHRARQLARSERRLVDREPRERSDRRIQGTALKSTRRNDMRTVTRLVQQPRCAGSLAGRGKTAGTRRLNSSRPRRRKRSRGADTAREGKAALERAQDRVAEQYKRSKGVATAGVQRGGRTEATNMPKRPKELRATRARRAVTKQSAEAHSAPASERRRRPRPRPAQKLPAAAAISTTEALPGEHLSVPTCGEAGLARTLR